MHYENKNFHLVYNPKIKIIEKIKVLNIVPDIEKKSQFEFKINQTDIKLPYGCPIINLSSFQILGFFDEESGENKKKIGYFIKDIIDNFNEEQKVKKLIKNKPIITLNYTYGYYDDSIRILGDYFVENNKDNCKILENNTLKELTTHINVRFLAMIMILEQKIDLVFLNPPTNLSGMFEECVNLVKVSNIDKMDISQVTDISFMFSKCENLESLPDISKWNTSNVTTMKSIFEICKNLHELPDISKWNISNLKDISFLISGCTNLERVPDISKWDTKNITNMSAVFQGCSSLKSLPDISKWDMSNVTDIRLMLGYLKLNTFPDISVWNTKNIIDMRSLFDTL